MKAALYIFLIWLVLWTGFTWEHARAPAPVVTEAPQANIPISAAPTTTESAKIVVKTEATAKPTPATSTASADTTAEERGDYNEEYVEELEQVLHKHINEERKKQGLNALAYDDTLAAVAAFHSTDMAKNDYFAHEDKKGCDSACRVTAVGYEWRAVGENLFMLSRGEHFSVDGASAVVVAGWLGSEGHRENLFNKEFTYEGIGVVIKGDSIYVTEVLAKPR